MSLFERYDRLFRGGTDGAPPIDPAADPVDLFRSWYRAAEERGHVLPEAVALATASPDAFPSVRMVLLKEVDERGFVFFTNYESRKAIELEANPRAALCFHWADMERQVRVEGGVERVSREASKAYFDTRPRGSRLGAWASRQSRPLASMDALERRLDEVAERFEGGPVPLPGFWGGYRLTPRRIELWQGRPSRLHERVVFLRDALEDPWRTERLHP